MANKYPGRCIVCGGYVAKHAGSCTKSGGRWVVSHLACAASGESEVVYTRFSSGAEVYQNRRGRCEDAPCCGCSKIYRRSISWVALCLSLKSLTYW